MRRAANDSSDSKPVVTQIRLLNLLNKTLDKKDVREVLGKLAYPYLSIQTGYARPTFRDC